MDLNKDGSATLIHFEQAYRANNIPFYTDYVPRNHLPDRDKSF
jgi:hypothetical protein